MNFEEYVRINYPSVLAEYIRYMRRDILPAVGDVVVTLRSGFGGGAGVHRKVVDVDDKYITLAGDGNHYLSDIKTWYKDIDIVDRRQND